MINNKKYYMVSKMLKKVIYILLITLMLSLSGCNGIEIEQLDSMINNNDFFETAFNENMSQGKNNVKLDLSSVSYGYVAISAYSDKRLKFQVTKDEEVYTYDIDSGGIPSIFPLQCGNGTYNFRVLENVEDSKYADIYFAEKEVCLIDEFQPYLRANDYVNYTKDSTCIQKANELAIGTDKDIDIVTNVFNYIHANIAYDNEKAKTVKTGYLPDPDGTLTEGKGICFDYASLTAAMLRSQGIPTKVIFGYVAPDNLYHAWNMFYTKESGWITVEYKSKGNEWNRLDLTFTVNEANEAFINNDRNYIDLYYY